MTDVQKSEAYSDIKELADKYKKFCFEQASRLKYDQVPRWIAFADGRVEEALQGGRSVGGSIKDMYVTYAISMLLGILAFWYLWIFYGVVFAFIGGRFVSLPLIAAAVIGGVIAVFLLAPLTLLISGGVFHLAAKVLGGKGTYPQTLSVVVMSSAAQT